jgi:glutamyl-tRNA synthetase
LKIYYRYAEKLIKLGFAYICTCDNLEWRKLRDKGESCPCRDLSIEDQLDRWQKMLNKEYHEGEAVLRIKTDLTHENPSVRDFAAMRIVDEPNHPLVKDKHLWPLYNFASAIDDHLLKITHILRGQEHALNTIKQKFIYDYLGWKYPNVIILGRFSLVGMVLSKSRTRDGIEKGEFKGWDDPKLGTLRALRRRGYVPEALRKLIIDMGVTSSDARIAEENLAAYNRKIIDNIADRYFFVEDPVKIYVEGLDKDKVKIPLHPDDEKRGYRTIRLNKSQKIFLIEKRDYKKFRNKEVRLKHLCNILLKKHAKVTSIEVKKGVSIIHWVPFEEKIHVDLIKPEKIFRGYGEINILNEKPENIVQFERVGFARIEKITKKKVIAVFAHK